MVRNYRVEVLTNQLLGETYVCIYYLYNPVPVVQINLYDWELLEKKIKLDIKEIADLIMESRK